jgi:hypothetical protein
LLDAFIIEELKRKEREREVERPRPAVPVPLPEDSDDAPRQSEDDKPQRGVVIIDYSV